MTYDVVIAGGGPAGLAAALLLGRARKRVLLCDAGPPRNAAADLVRGFVTRDGISPAEFRRIAREQLAPYRSVELRDTRVDDVRGECGRFTVNVGDSRVEARRILLATGLIDVLPDIPGYRELWGHSVFQCPYCHGFERVDRPWGYLAPSEEWLDWALLMTSWTDRVVAFTNAAFAVPDDARARLEQARVRLEERRIVALRASGGELRAVALAGDTELPCEALFVKPLQRQTDLVVTLGVKLDEKGYVQVDERRETSIKGIYAAGDATTRIQGAGVAAGMGAHSAYTLNFSLTLEAALGYVVR